LENLKDGWVQVEIDMMQEELAFSKLLTILDLKIWNSKVKIFIMKKKFKMQKKKKNKKKKTEKKKNKKKKKKKNPQKKIWNTKI